MWRAVSRRYGQRLAPACGLLGGTGLDKCWLRRCGYNVVVIGRGAEEMALVDQGDSGWRLLRDRNGQVPSHLPLPLPD